MRRRIRVYPAPEPPLGGTVTVTEKAGVTTTNYPMQIGRPFAEGAVAHYPQAVVAGTPVTTQVAVKTRWPDGSIKHAILCFYIPTLAANSTVAITFQDQPGPSTDSGLDAPGMLDAAFDFEAAIALTSGAETLRASARTMLADGRFTTWLSGPICTSIVLADHSAYPGAYDQGFAATAPYKPFRPIFEATFWPAIAKVYVRVIGEMGCNTEAFLPLLPSSGTVHADASLGLASPASILSQDNVYMFMASRWTRTGWIGGAPSAINCDHGVDYLASTKGLPNYDPAFTIPDSHLASRYASWQTVAALGIYHGGDSTHYSNEIRKDMPGPGAMTQIGPFPEWDVQWFYSGDYRAKARALGNADLSAAFPVHAREGSKLTGTGIGKWTNQAVRPTVRFYYGVLPYYDSYWLAADRFQPTSTTSATPHSSFEVDMAHIPCFCVVPYLLTGEHFYLEEMLAWGTNPPAFGHNGSRGPTHGYPWLIGAERACGWGFHISVEVANLIPDSFAEKAYYVDWIRGLLCAWEGPRGVASARSGDAEYLYFADNTKVSRTYFMNWATTSPPPLRSFTKGYPYPTSYPLQAPTALAEPNWMQHFIILALGRGKELGFDCGPLLSYLAPWTLDQINGTNCPEGWNWQVIGAYVIPSATSPTAYMTTWAEVMSGFDPTYVATVAIDPDQDSPILGQSYHMMALCATSFLFGEPGGAEAWNRFRAIYTEPRSHWYANNPQYWILPRT